MSPRRKKPTAPSGTSGPRYAASTLHTEDRSAYIRPRWDAIIWELVKKGVRVEFATAGFSRGVKINFQIVDATGTVRDLRRVILRHEPLEHALQDMAEEWGL